MNTRAYGGGAGGGGFGLGLTGPVQTDVWVLLGVIFATFSLQFFGARELLWATLRLTPAVWQSGFLWQLVTYPFIGYGEPSFWFLLELLILFLFARQVLGRLGRRRFWTLLVMSAAVGGVAAVALRLLAGVVTQSADSGFVLMQGQHMVAVILIAAFATLYGQATILLFFVLPVQAKWFLGLEILFAFMGYLGTGDLAGFVGICAAVAATWWSLRGGWAERRELWLRAQAAWMRMRLAWLRRRRGLRVVQGDKKDSGPWVH